MKYAWIERHKHHWPISLQCGVLNVSVSGYCEHQRRKPLPSGKRLSDDALLVHIKAAHAASKGEYGWPRIWQEHNERVKRYELQGQGQTFETRVIWCPEPESNRYEGLSLDGF